MTTRSTFFYLKNYFAALVWAGIIAFLSLTAAHNLPRLDWTFFTPDKVGHFTVYGILAFLVLWGANKSDVLLPIRRVIFVAFAASAYGFLMEWLQYWLTPDRCFEYPDMLANAIGASLGCLIFYFFVKKTSRTF